MSETSPAPPFRHIRWETDQGIGHLVLSRPPSNDMTAGLIDEIARLTDILGREPRVTGIVIRGEGRHFSSGAALDELLADIDATNFPAENAPGEEHFLLRNYRSMLWFEDAAIPVVAAIRGVCLGSAFELALLAHFRISTEDAVFGLPETTFNLIPGLGGIRKIAELAGKAKAIELVLRGRTFSASEALEAGLIDCIVPKKELQNRAAELVMNIGQGYRKGKRSLYLHRYLSGNVSREEQAV